MLPCSPCRRDEPVGTVGWHLPAPGTDAGGLRPWVCAGEPLPQCGLHLQLPSAPGSGVLSDVVTAIHVIPAETLQCY